MKAKVVVLSSRSLYSEGVLSRLQQHAGQIELHVVDGRLPDSLAEITSLSPSAVILDATDAEVAKHCPLERMLQDIPGLKIIRLDPEQQGFLVVTSQQHQAEEVQDLLEILNRASNADEE
ncbi:MAG: hypothetical protein GTO14_02120 [Anaerolineales bacterium]|nr:hypothetical protein [Anaerolineales bacterium]